MFAFPTKLEAPGGEEQCLFNLFIPRSTHHRTGPGRCPVNVPDSPKLYHFGILFHVSLLRNACFLQSYL